MRPYATIRLRSDLPLAGGHDALVEGRPTHVERSHGLDHASAAKRGMRRALKRADRARCLAEELGVEQACAAEERRELEELERRFLRECRGW